MSLQEQISRIQEIMKPKNPKGWSGGEKKLEKEFSFKDFATAMDFVNKVAKISEKQNHHPDIEIKYNKVYLSITDHEKGKVSEKCIKLIGDIEKL